MSKLIFSIPLLFWFTTASAEGAPAGAMQSSGMMSQFFLLGGFILIFYFLLWRPQSKRAKAHRDLLSGITKDDEVVTSGGVVGKVTKVSDAFIRLSVAEGIEICVQKQAIASSLPKGTLKSI